MRDSILFFTVVIVILVVPTATILAYEIYLKEKIKGFFLRSYRLTQQMIHNMSDLKNWLAEHKIDFSRWGIGSAKSVQDLFREIEKGDTKLVATKRLVEVAVIIIRSGEKFLVETKQEFSDNRTRMRSWPPSEKFSLTEGVEAAARRCLFEELALRKDQIKSVKVQPNSIIQEKKSSSYPGLVTRYKLHIIEADVSGLPMCEFSTQEAEVSQDQIVKWHFWDWGDLPPLFSQLYS